MKDIEKFKPLYYYKNIGEKLTTEEAKKLETIESRSTSKPCVVRLEYKT